VDSLISYDRHVDRLRGEVRNVDSLMIKDSKLGPCMASSDIQYPVTTFCKVHVTTLKLWAR
jgi:hypothetical protein